MVKVVALYLVAAIFLLACVGCSTTTTRHYGDARVLRTDFHFSLFAVITPQYEMELPEVSLSKQQTMRFVVKGIPSDAAKSVLPTELYLKLPQKDHSPLDRENVNRKLPWEDCVVTITITALSGNAIYQETFWLKDLPWAYQQRRFFGWDATSKLPHLGSGFRGKQDYLVRVSIEKPSSRKQDSLQIRGRFFVGGLVLPTAMKP